MAISRGAGTEIIRTIHLQETDGEQTFIYGVQHHIYTVLSVVVRCVALQATTNKFYITFVGWDAHTGASAVSSAILSQNIAVGETFVWNDKFSFNGHEPTGLSGALGAGDAAATILYQDAIADQGSSTAQYMKAGVDNAADDFDVLVTYIDQNNA